MALSRSSSIGITKSPSAQQDPTPLFGTTSSPLAEFSRHYSLWASKQCGIGEARSSDVSHVIGPTNFSCTNSRAHPQRKLNASPNSLLSSPLLLFERPTNGMTLIPDSLQYVLLMAACLLITLPLEFVLGARVYRKPLRLLQAILITVIVFAVWDIIAIHFGMWTYSDRFTSGITLPFGLPLEELLFFIAIPLCGILTFEAVGKVFAFFTSRSRRSKKAMREGDHA